MIPFAILSGKLIEKNSHMLEFRILDLAPDSFTFRLAEPLTEPDSVEAIALHFFLQEDHALHPVVLEKDTFLLQPEADEDHEVPWDQNNGKPCPFWYTYRITTDQGDFIRHSQALMKDYLGYIRLKQAGDDGALMRQLTGYPKTDGEVHPAEDGTTNSVCNEAANSAGEEGNREDVLAEPGWQGEYFTASWDEQSAALEARLQKEPDPLWLEAYRRIPSIAVSLENPDQWEAFLQLEFEEFLGRSRDVAGQDGSWKTADPDRNWNSTCLAARRPDTICIGNPYCSHLFPTDAELEMLSAKCHHLQLKLAVMLAPVREMEWERMQARIDRVMTLVGRQETCSCGSFVAEAPEIMVNDLGMLRYVADHYPRSEITIGPLLLKRKKDVRRKWAWSQPVAGEVAEFYQDYLRGRYHVSGLAMDVDGSDLKLPRNGIGVSLMGPFFQMNTAGNCTLYAICKNGSRGKQEAVRDCPQYCRKQVLLYPKRLGMVGRYNSLLGYDDRILTDGAYLRAMLGRGMKRLIINC